MATGRKAPEQIRRNYAMYVTDPAYQPLLRVEVYDLAGNVDTIMERL